LERRGRQYGIYPDLETIKNDKYPLSSQFFAVTLSDNEKPNVLKLLDWIISEQGQQLIEKKAGVFYFSNIIKTLS
jgi:phosphate transport system substrate-binding protein